MPCHLLAYYSTAVDGSSGYAAVAPLTDPFCAPDTSAATFIPPRDLELLVVAAGGTILSGARFESTALAAIAYPHVTPFQSALSDSMPASCDYSQGPPRIVDGEGLSFKIENASSSPAVGLALCGFDCVPAPSGQATWLKYSMTGATAAGAWDPYVYGASALTWEQDLAAGTYAVLGMDHWSTTAMAARLILPGYIYRPGVRARTEGGGQADPVFLSGHLGIMGWFSTRQMPGIDHLSSGVEASFEGRVLVVRVGGPDALPPPR